MIAASTYNITGTKPGQPFNLDALKRGKLTRFGINIIRHYMGAPPYALPAGHTNIEVLTDLEKVLLFFCSNITVGPTSVYADYVFPRPQLSGAVGDARFTPQHAVKVQPIRQPVIAPLTETVRVFGEEQPCSFEAVLLALAEKPGVPGFGPNGSGAAQPLTRSDNFYIRMVANIALDGSLVPDADDEEAQLFLNARKHLPNTVFDHERWQRIAGAHWRKVVYVLNRGGRFQEYTQRSTKASRCLIGTASSPTSDIGKNAGPPNAFTGKPNIGYTIRCRCHCAGRVAQTSPAGGGLPIAPACATRHPAHSIKHGGELLATHLAHRKRVADPCWPCSQAGARALGDRFGDLTIDGEVVRGDPRRARRLHANAAMVDRPLLEKHLHVGPSRGKRVFL